MNERMQGVGRAVRRVLAPRVWVLGGLLLGGYAVLKHPPVDQVGRQELGLRVNQWTGGVTQLGEGTALVVPGLHELRRLSLRDRLYRPERVRRADGEAPLQSLEGLSLGIELGVRYAPDPKRLAQMAGQWPDDLDRDLVEPAVQGVIYKLFARYTVREIFSSQRHTLQKTIEAELRPILARDGLLLRSVTLGNVDLPADYRAGMDRLLAVELQSEQMKYTLELKEKQVKESELQAEAESVRRAKEAEAAANEQIIAARAQEEAMRHVLPFKQKQIEQRKLEAEAERLSRVSIAEGNAQARRIEAAGEAESRQKLADAEAYRLEQLGKVSSAQLERDGALVSRYPLLIQKTMADKLSDNVSVIIAAPPSDGSFIGSNLLGQAGGPRTNDEATP